MIALLLTSVVLIIVGSWFLSIIFLRLPDYILHGFDWTVSWIHVFDGVGRWLILAVVVVMISWFLEE